MTVAHYKNGNYSVFIDLKTGTKIRYNKEDTLTPSRPESIDVKITNKCNHQCFFCHENSTPNGKKASYKTMEKFVSDLPEYTEIAVGGGNLLEDTDHTEWFLRMLVRHNCIPSITVQQEDFLKHRYLLEMWYKQQLFYGLGVSLSNAQDKNFIYTITHSEIPTIVLHVIVGLFNQSDFKTLSKQNLKILILGYKEIRRGKQCGYLNTARFQFNKDMLIKYLRNGIAQDSFATISFDNLALEQLKIREILPKEVWNKYYMGDDGEYTFYVDLVEETFAKSSIEIADRISFKNLYLSPQEMFDLIKR